MVFFNLFYKSLTSVHGIQNICVKIYPEIVSRCTHRILSELQLEMQVSGVDPGSDKGANDLSVFLNFIYV